MQVYKGFDIGTDKLPPEKRENIPHYLLDIIDPHIQFTAADFANQALEAIESILKKKRLPIIVGGTGLYLKALCGEINNFTGVSSPYEEPVNPNLIVNTEKNSIEYCVDRIIEYLEKHKSI